MCREKLSLPQNVETYFCVCVCVCVRHLSGRPSWGSAMAVSPVAASDQAEGGSATWRGPQSLAAEKEGAGRD